MGKEKSKIMPFAGKILVKRIEQKEVKKSGIIIPDTAKEKPQQGIIVEISGDPCYQNGKPVEFKQCLKKGDKILFGKYAGTEIEFDGEEFIIMEQTDVLAIIK